MPTFDLAKVDPLVATSFYLELAGDSGPVNITSVDGLQVEIEKAEYTQRTADGKFVQQVGMSKPKFAGELTIKRLAPLDMSSDKLWEWFMAIREKGMSATDRATTRKDGSIVLYGTDLVEVSRWNFFHAWPSKIQADSLDATKNDPIHESITLQYEKLERIK